MSYHRYPFWKGVNPRKTHAIDQGTNLCLLDALTHRKHSQPKSLEIYSQVPYDKEFDKDFDHW